jgi:hypothetical protein
MDRVAYSTTTYGANQGFFLRWSAPSFTNYPRYLFAFYFGQYAIVIGGSGLAYLWEYCAPIGSNARRWIRRDKWRFAPQGTVPGTAHSMGVFPHRAPNGDVYVCFTDIASSIAPRTNTSEILSTTSAVVDTWMYKVDQTVRGTDQDASPGYATEANQIRIDMRRDLRMDLQISTLAFPTTVGTLKDDDTMIGGGAWTDNPNAPVVTMSSVQPANTSITANIVDAVTGGPFLSGPAPNTSMFMQAQFTFASTDGKNTPQLWGYSIKQPPVVSTSSPGQFSMSGQSYEIEGYGGDPQDEIAIVRYTDQSMQHTRLTKRGRFSALLQTTALDGGGNPITVNLFRGVCRKPRSSRRGAGWNEPGYLAPDFREYYLTLTGMWDVLNDNDHVLHSPLPRTYAMDPNEPVGSIETWKVTDAIVDMLTMCGFTSDQINIPNLSYRFWPGFSRKVEDLTIAPAQSIPEFLVRIVREYLGAYLYFEPNAGARGQWILIFGSQPNAYGQFTPVYNFVTSAPSGAIPTDNSAYAANTTFIQGGRKAIDYTQNAPDFNTIWVSCPVPTRTPDNQMQIALMAANPLSYAVPGMQAQPNPEHPDYYGRCKPLRIVAPHLYAGDYNSTFGAVWWTVRRLYDFLCHGQKLATFDAPLSFIYDSALAGSSSGGYRPIRFQDPVSIDGDASWLVKHVRPHIDFDGTQMCTYECIQPFPGQMFYGADGRIQEKQQIRRMSQRTVGLGTHSAAYALFAPSAHKEAGLLELPFVRSGFGPIQYDDGSFIPVAGWYTNTGAMG